MRPVIKTDRLVLRQLRLSDAQAFSRLAGDRDIARMTGSIPHPFPPLAAETKITMLLAQKRQGLAYPYAITEDGGDLIGVGDLFRRQAEGDLELGYWIGKPYWGQGYITEVCEALIHEAEVALGVDELVAGVFADNPGSMRVLEKLGFKRHGQPELYFSMARLRRFESVPFLRRSLQPAI